MSESSTSNDAGIGFTGVLFIVFLVLKLTDRIGWSWWWVTAPLWGPVVFVLLVFVVMGAAALTVRVWEAGK